MTANPLKYAAFPASFGPDPLDSLTADEWELAEALDTEWNDVLCGAELVSTSTDGSDDGSETHPMIVALHHRSGHDPQAARRVWTRVAASRASGELTPLTPPRPRARHGQVGFLSAGFGSMEIAAAVLLLLLVGGVARGLHLPAGEFFTVGTASAAPVTATATVTVPATATTTMVPGVLDSVESAWR